MSCARSSRGSNGAALRHGLICGRHGCHDCACKFSRHEAQEQEGLTLYTRFDNLFEQNYETAFDRRGIPLTGSETLGFFRRLYAPFEGSSDLRIAHDDS